MVLRTTCILPVGLSGSAPPGPGSGFGESSISTLSGSSGSTVPSGFTGTMVVGLEASVLSSSGLSSVPST